MPFKISARTVGLRQLYLFQRSRSEINPEVRPNADVVMRELLIAFDQDTFTDLAYTIYQMSEELDQLNGAVDMVDEIVANAERLRKALPKSQR